VVKPRPRPTGCACSTRRRCDREASLTLKHLPYISPTPLLLAVAEGDHLVPAELAIAADERAHQPKELVILPGGHFDAYTVGFDASSGAARDWFVRHLAP
jgi:uncharacterized protein